MELNEIFDRLGKVDLNYRIINVLSTKLIPKVVLLNIVVLLIHDTFAVSY